MRRFVPDGPDAGPPLPARADADPTLAARGPSSAGPEGGAPPLERLLRFFVAPPVPQGPRPVAPPAPRDASPAGWPAPEDGGPLEEDEFCGAGLLTGDRRLSSADPRADVEAPPAAPHAVHHAGRTDGASRVVVIGGAGDVRAAARAVAARLAAMHGRSAGVLASWSAADAPEPASGAPTRSGLLPPRGGAARLATALAERGHDARAAGRLVEVRLGEEPGAVAEAERVQDVARDAPVVLALGGARGEAWDRLLAAQDLVLLAAGPQVPEALASVALAIAQDRCAGVPVRMVAVSAGRRPRPSRADLAALVALLEGR